MPDRTIPPLFFRQPCPSKVKGMEAPHHLSRQAIGEFKAIYQEEFRQNISDDEAQEIALRLLRVFDILLRPFPDDISDHTVIL